MKKWIVLWAILSISVMAFSFDLSFYNSFETLTMGETFTGISDDINALYYNPAGLVNGNGFALGLPGLNTGMSYGAASATVKAITHINEIQSILNGSDNLKIADYFLKNYSKALSGRNDICAKSSAYVGFEGENFALMGAAFGQTYANLLVSNDIVPFISLHAKAAAYVEGAGALAFNIRNTKLSFGGTYRYGYAMPHIYSVENLSVLLVDSSTFNPDFTYEATSNADVGVKVSWGNWNVGGIWRNMMSAVPDTRIGVGFVAKSFAFGIDFEKLFDNDYSIYRRIHVGIRYTPFDFLRFYGGMSAGWLTGGLEIKLGPLSLYGGTYVFNYGYHAGYDSQRMYTIGFGI